MPNNACRDSSPVEKSSVGRQVLIIIVVIVIFAALLAVYLQLSGGAGQILSATDTPLPAPTDTAAPTVADTPSPSDTAAAPPTEPPPPTGTPAPAAAATTDAATAAAVAETLVVEDIAAGDVSFMSDVLPIFEARCTQCHGSSSPRAGISLASYDDVLAGAARQVVVPGDADASRLAQVVVSGKMPPRGDKLTTEQIQFIVDWINAKAPNN